MRRIAHLDMDAFYASVELLRRPQLRGLPLVVGGGRSWHAQAAGNGQPPRLADYRGRGVVTTCSYEARAFGVRSAMPMMRAARLCPQALVLPPDFDEYRRLSQAFKAVVTEIAPVMEDRGIDEVYIDFTDVPGGQREGGASLARLIQRTIRQQTGLSCSIGVAPNKLLAKMASEFDKPGGISVLYEHELQSRIWPLAVGKINGIGPKLAARLAALGIATIGELAAADREQLRAHFGPRHGAWLHDAAHGRDERALQVESEPVSISRETTFERDLHAVRDRAELAAIFTRLCERLAGDLQRKGYVGASVGIKLRYADFRSVTREQTLAAPVADAAALRRHAGQCLKRVDLSRPLRLLGVRVGRLARPGAGPAAGPAPPAMAAPAAPQTLPLFD
jgi:DNA polymerase-4